MHLTSQFGAAFVLAALGFTATYAASLAQTTATPHLTAGQISFGPTHGKQFKTYNAFYDSHLDAYINTDVSSKSQAKLFHLNYAPITAKAVPSATSPEYFVVGRKASGQLAVFGSEPPDPSYSPLWQEFIVRWKSGVTPTVLKSDNDVFAMQHKGKLTYIATKVVITAPVLHVGK